MELRTRKECERAEPDTPVQRACDKVKTDFEDLIHQIETLRIKVEELNKLEAQASAEKQVLDSVEPAVRAWQGGVGNVDDLKSHRGRLHVSARKRTREAPRSDGAAARC